MKTIIITGTPGTGKTTIAKKLAKMFGFKLINTKSLISNNSLNGYFDKCMNCKVVDVKKLNKLLITIIKHETKDATSGLIIDSHLSHYLPQKYVDLCIVTKCNLKKLKERLNKRRYSSAKIRENLDCEIFDVCLTEAVENKHKCVVIDTTKSVSLKSLSSVIKRL